MIQWYEQQLNGRAARLKRERVWVQFLSTLKAVENVQTASDCKTSMLNRVDRYINYQTRACAITTGYFIFVWFQWKVQVANTEPVPALSFLLWDSLGRVNS